MDESQRRSIIELTELRAEYLVVFAQHGNRLFCTDITSFNHLLGFDTGISTESGTLDFKEVSAQYDVNVELADERQAVFHVSLTCPDVEQLDLFRELLRELRRVWSRAQAEVRTLWTDEGYYYSIRAYPLIYTVENLMRKLIDRFMYKNVGREWERKYLPQEVREAVRRTTQRGSNDPFSGTPHLVDFKDLGVFMFEPYVTQPAENLYSMLREAESVDDLDVDELKALVPRSNWERYFGKLVQGNDTHFREQWERLYELRCAIAHNRIIGAGEYQEIEEIADELTNVLSEAVERLSEVNVPKGQTEAMRVWWKRCEVARWRDLMDSVNVPHLEVFINNAAAYQASQIAEMGERARSAIPKHTLSLLEEEIEMVRRSAYEELAKNAEIARAMVNVELARLGMLGDSGNQVVPEDDDDEESQPDP